MVKHLAKVQKGLLRAGFKSLKSGGVLVYSTCTLEPEEDEGVVNWVLENFEEVSLEKIEKKELPGLKRSEAIRAFEKEEYLPDVKKGLRIWPQDNGTEGFFVARFRKR